MNSFLTIKRKLKINRDTTWGYTFIAVALVVFSLFTAYPVISAFIISLQEYRPLGSTYVGLENFKETFESELFWKAIKNTVVYTIFTVPVNIFLAFVVSILVYPFKKRTQTIFKAMYYLPTVASGVALAVVWLWIFGPAENWDCQSTHWVVWY